MAVQKWHLRTVGISHRHHAVAVVALVAGIAAPIAYVVFALISCLHLENPTTFTPITNKTLSMLGSRFYNPDGAMFYRIGCAVTGALVVTLFVCLTPWRRSGTPLQNRSLVLMQIAGVIGGIGMIMNGLFPDEIHVLHYYSAGVVFIGFVIAVLISFYALRRTAHSDGGLMIVGALVVVTTFVMFIFGTTHWLEWPPMALGLIYMGVLGYHTWRIDTWSG